MHITTIFALNHYIISMMLNDAYVPPSTVNVVGTLFWTPALFNAKQVYTPESAVTGLVKTSDGKVRLIPSVSMDPSISV